MTPTESAHVGEQLAELRGEIRTGFAKVDGALALLVQRGDQTDKDIDELRQDVEALKRNRWPLPSLAAITGCAALGLTLYEIAAR
ncbi:hypothetical protein ACGFY0_45375 [Streptomyces chartreusis]|uniref:hypothetical protein n=1 Tax=Streptomyces chartreusis TaxID=1969 RepID=UPI0037150C9E